MRRFLRSTRFVGVAAALQFLGCNPEAVEPDAAPPDLRGRAIALTVDMQGGTVGPASGTSLHGGARGPMFSLIGQHEVAATVTNVTRTVLSASWVRVRFDLALTNQLANSDFVPATFPAAPKPEVVAFPFGTDPSGLFGLKVIANSDWDGAPWNFFNDAVCLPLTPPSDCYRWEGFGGSIPPGATTPARAVGFDVSASIKSFTVYVVIAADIHERPLPALMSVSQVASAFTAIPGGANPPSQAVVVTNAGGGTLTGLTTDVAYQSGQPTGWLVASLGSTTAPATLTLRSTTAGLAPGLYNATVRLGSLDAANSPVSISVALILAPPMIALSATNASFQAGVGGPPSSVQQIEVTSTTGVPASGLGTNAIYSGGPASEWLRATLSGTTTPAMLTLQATPGTLGPGEYFAELRVTSAVSGTVSVLVSLRLDLLPDLQFAGSPDVVVGSGSVTLANIVITNRGLRASGPFKVAAALCLSPSVTPAAGDCGLETHSTESSLDPGGVDLISSLVLTSSPNSFDHVEPGVYYLILWVDPPLLNEVPESDETNNAIVLGPITIGN